LYATIRQATEGKEDTPMTAQAGEIRHQAISEWVQGLYYYTGDLLLGAYLSNCPVRTEGCGRVGG
jgi:hypothetical protein